MSDIVGHDAQIHALTEAVASGRLHHGWILAGPKGIGKATLARAFARRLLADAAGPLSTLPGLDVDASHPIARLMDAGKWFYGKVINKTWEGNWLKIDIEIYLKE